MKRIQPFSGAEVQYPLALARLLEGHVQSIGVVTADMDGENVLRFHGEITSTCATTMSGYSSRKVTRTTYDEAAGFVEAHLGCELTRKEKPRTPQAGAHTLTLAECAVEQPPNQFLGFLIFPTIPGGEHSFSWIGVEFARDGRLTDIFEADATFQTKFEAIDDIGATQLIVGTVSREGDENVSREDDEDNTDEDNIIVESNSRWYFYPTE
jgi:hypothetical protein